ncbi:MAG: biotin transporter BioY [Oscillospiraceae bacterium]|nr:biotin transporter BioY [Oscillospiraceae bacterium]
MRKNYLSIRDICQIAIFVALIIVLAQVRIPMPYSVPVTLQSFVIPFSAVVLGAKHGTIAAVVYVLLGAVGLPVFSGAAGGFGGIGAIVGPTGGFILTFPLYAFLAGWGADRGRRVWLAVGLIVGLVLFFLCGMLQFALVTGQGLRAAFGVTVFPFFFPIPTELIKVLFVWVLGPRVRGLMHRALQQNG